MTAEQLEELQLLVDSVDNDTVDPYGGISPCFAADLARRVLAAEKLVEAFEDRLRGADNATECYTSIHAYREASK